MFLQFFSYVKLAVTLIKYVPQVRTFLELVGYWNACIQTIACFTTSAWLLFCFNSHFVQPMGSAAWSIDPHFAQTVHGLCYVRPTLWLHSYAWAVVLHVYHVNFCMYTCKWCFTTKNQSIIVDRVPFNDIICQNFVEKTKDRRGAMLSYHTLVRLIHGLHTSELAPIALCNPWNIVQSVDPCFVWCSP